MTVSATANRASYSGNGVTTAFPFPYKFLLNADLTVYVRINSSGVVSTKVLDTDYTVSGAAESSGGTVTMTTAPAVGETVVVVGLPAVSQTMDLVPNDALPADSLETANDRTVIISRMLKDLIDRCTHLAPSYSDSFDTSLPVLITAETILGINEDGDGFKLYTGAELLALIEASIALDLTEFETLINDHIADTTDAHDASAISNVPSGNLAATDVQTALDELQSDIDTRATSASLTAHEADTSTHGVGVIAGLTEVQTFTNKTLTAPVIDVASLTEQGSTPTTPSAGTKKFYAKNDGKLYSLDSSGLEAEIGSGSGGGGSGLSWYVRDDESGNSPTSLQYMSANSIPLKVLVFPADDASIYTTIKVPQSYQAGSRISLLNGKFFAPTSDGTKDMQFKVSTFLVKTSDNLSTLSMLAGGTSGTLVETIVQDQVYETGPLYLNDLSGNIDGNAVAAGDFITVELTKNLVSPAPIQEDIYLIVDDNLNAFDIDFEG